MQLDIPLVSRPCVLPAAQGRRKENSLNPTFWKLESRYSLLDAQMVIVNTTALG